MKRCPQCEFIYEDDQSHCDMDGAHLTHDSHPLPKLQALATSSEALTKSKWRTRVVPIMAALILTSVLGLVYYVSMHQSSRRSTEVVTSPAAETPVNNLESSPATPGSNSVPSPESNLEADPKTSEPKPATDAPITEEKPPSVSQDAKKPEQKAATKPTATDKKAKTKQQAQNSASPAPTVKPAEKNDSKVRSMLRKTGRFLKKTLPL